MEAQKPLRIHGVVTCGGEHEPFILGIKQALHWLKEAGCAAPTIALNFSPEFPPSGQSPPADIVMISFLGDVPANHEDFETMAGGWRRQVAEFIAASDALVFLCTVFRHVAPGSHGHDRVMALRERIRRINLLVAELSQSTGAYVIDIDSALAHIGGDRLQSDFSLTGRLGAPAAGDIIASALLAEGFEGCAPADGVARAIALHGGRRGVFKRLNHATMARVFHGAA